MQTNNGQQQGQRPNYPFFSANPPPARPTYNASPSILSTLSQDELRRHQLASNGTSATDPYVSGPGTMFPLPGARRAFGPNQPSTVPGMNYTQQWTGNDDVASSAVPQIGNNAASISLNDSTHSSPTRRAAALSGEAAGFEEFLAEMPAKGEDAARHTMFTELIKMKTKSIELQIAEARRKEKEAESELARWKAASDRRMTETNVETGSNVTPNTFQGMGLNPYDMERASIDSTAGGSSMFPPSNAPSTNPPGNAQVTGGLSMSIPAPENPPTPITHFDLEAMMHDSNLEGLFAWLPDFATQQQQQPQMPHQYQQQQQQQQQEQMPPLQQPGQSLPQQSMSSLDNNSFLFGNMSTPYLTTNESLDTPSLSYNTLTSPVKRSASPISDNEATSPHVKRSKKSNEKKIVVERSASCPGCAKTIGRIMFRAPRAHMPDDISVDLKCPSCAAVDASATLPDPATMGSSIGTVEMRKRMRATLESEDEEKGSVVRRQFCDVCQRVVASGRLVAGAKESMSSIAEIVCAPCDAKYQRCTDCGGGGGPRIGIGKWRMKQVFPLGRKTCSLSHTRLGDRPREIGVHVTPSDFSPEQLKEVLTRTKGLWNEKTLARLAVPEMLEIDLPPDVINPLRDYADVEDIITRNWPTREAMIKADGADPARFKRLLGLIWAHPKSRRAVRTIDLEEEEYARNVDEDEADMSTVLANVKRTNVVIPPGSELVGMWGGEWDMKHGALLITTLIPFEGADGEDSTALSVGEMITMVQGLRQKINDERKSLAAQQGKQPDLVPQCEHLWVVSGGTMPLVRERVADFLIRKRSFVHVEEYLTRHPDFIHALKARPVGLHPDLHRPIRSANGEEDEIEARPLVLVRWLGKDFDAAKIREIKLQEFGGKAKLKGKKAKGKV